MRNWILAFLAGLAVLAAGVSTQAADKAPPPPVFNPMNAETMRNMDWSLLEKTALWKGARRTPQRNQPNVRFGWKYDRSNSLRMSDLKFDVDFATNLANPGRRIVRFFHITPQLNQCEVFRRSVIAVYGEPVAQRRMNTKAKVVDFVLTSNREWWQWKAGNTMITQRCDVLTVNSSSLSIALEVEPITTAPTLAPSSSLECAGVEAESDYDRTKLDPQLRIDHYENIATRDDGRIIGSITRSGDKVTFPLLGARNLTIDMTTMAYSASGGGGANRDGTCELTYTFEERKGG